MPSWKKVITSGSSAHLSHVTASANISGSATSTGSFGELHIPTGIGKIGIGTTAPSSDITIYRSSAKLALMGAGSPRLDVMNTSGNEGLRIEKDGTSTKISNYASGEGARITLQGSSAGGDVLINNDLLVSGNVGIGTTTPGSTLTVAGDISGSGNFHLKNNQALWMGSAAGATDYNAIFTDTDDKLIFRTNNTLAMAIDDANQNVGIGTSSPDSPLEIESSNDPLLNLNKTGGGNAALHFEHAGTDKGYIYVDTSMNMHFGNTSVNPTFEITSAGTGIFAQNIQLSNGQQLQWGDANNAIFGHAGSDYVQIKTDGTDRVKINSSGIEVFTGNVSGSSTSTGSFGHVISTTIRASKIIGKSPLSIESDNINIDTSGNYSPGGNISGSSTSTGSFAQLALPQTGKLVLDSNGGTFLYEKTNNDVRMVVGETESALFLAAGMGVPATQKVYLDGGGDTYIHETSADRVLITVGGTNLLDLSENGGGSSDYVAIRAQSKLYFDGGGNTYINEHSADDLRVVVGGTTSFDFLSTGAGVSATGKLYLDGGGNTYLHESSADNIKATVGGTDVLDITSTKISGSSTSTGSFGIVTTNKITKANPYPRDVIEFGNYDRVYINKDDSSINAGLSVYNANSAANDAGLSVYQGDGDTPAIVTDGVNASISGSSTSTGSFGAAMIHSRTTVGGHHDNLDANYGLSVKNNLGVFGHANIGRGGYGSANGLYMYGNPVLYREDANTMLFPLTTVKVTNLTATGTVQAEHLYSTDDVQIDDDLTVGGEITGSSVLFTTAGAWNRDDVYPFSFINLDGQTDQSYGMLVRGGANAAGGKIFTGMGYDAKEHFNVFGDGGVHVRETLTIGAGIRTTPIGDERIHVHRYSANGSFMRFTNTNSGHDDADNSGIIIGQDDSEQAQFMNQENADMFFGVNKIERLRITTDNKISGSASSIASFGELIVAGNITAQQYIVSASTTYMTTSFSDGNTKFGDSSGDVHQFTGSFRTKGSMTTDTSLTVGSEEFATNFSSSISGRVSTLDAASSGITISNNSNNRILTGDGTNANAESNLTFDGAVLGVSSSANSPSPTIQMMNTNTTNESGSRIEFYKNATADAGDEIGSIDFYHKNTNSEKHKYAFINASQYATVNGNEGAFFSIRGKTISVTNDPISIIQFTGSQYGTIRLGEHRSIITGSGNSTGSFGKIIGDTFHGDGAGLTGTATSLAVGTATTATNVTTTANNSANETVYLAFVDGTSGGQGIEVDTGLNYNPSTEVLHTTTFDGNATTATTATTATNVNVTANNSTSETIYVTFVDGTSGAQGIETDTNLTYNPNTNTLATTTFSGNATTATTATNVSVTANNSTSENIYVAFVDGTSGAQGIETDVNLTYNPNTNTLATTTFDGNATTATTATNVSVTANNSNSEIIYVTFVDGTSGAQGIETDVNLTYNPNTNTLATTTFDGNATSATTATNVTLTANNTTNENVYITFADGTSGAQGIETDTNLSYNPSTNTLTAGTLSGNATSATTATNVTATANNTTNENVYLTFVDGVSGAQGIETDTNLSYNPSTNVLTAGTFNGAFSGDGSQLSGLPSIGGIFVATGSAVNTTNNLQITGSLNATGDVGIGIENPLDKLHVVQSDDEGALGSADADNVAIFQNNYNASDAVYATFIGGTTGYAGLHFGDKDDSDAGILRYDLYAGDGGGGFQFHTEGSERMAILANGKVGIGETIPDELLHIKSSDASNPVIKLENAGDVTNGAQLHFVMSTTSEGDNDIPGTIRFKGMNSANSETEFSTIYTRNIDITDGTEDSEMHFRTMNAGSLSSTMMIKSGNVGIGTTSPTNNLSVYNDSAATSINIGKYASGKAVAVLGTSADTNGYFQIQSYYAQGSTFGDIILNPQGGKVGIGKTAPVGKLHVLGESYNHLELESASGNVAITFDVETTNTNYYDWRIDAQGTVANALCFGHSTAAGNQTFNAANMVMTMLSSGNVGIGTTNPIRPLDVAVASGDNTIRMATAGQAVDVINLRNADGRIGFGGDVITVSGSNVGIGTANPSSPLHIKTSTNENLEFEEASGNLRISALNDARSANVELQFAASQFHFLTGNVGIGKTAPTKPLEVVGDISGSGDLYIQGGLVDLKNDGSQSEIRLYCESANAHYVGLKAPVHSAFSGNVAVTLPATATTLIGTNTTDTLTNKTIGQHLLPDGDNTRNLGSANERWANLFTGDLHLSNEGGKGNDVDKTTGDWTIQEGEDDLYLLNNKSGKKYKFKLEEL